MNGLKNKKKNIKKNKKTLITPGPNNNGEKYENWKLDEKPLNRIDVTCPICLSILIKPVSLPCSHTLCMVCFERTVSESNLTCPLCRKRISVWLRRVNKTKSMVDEKLWQKIQEDFKDEVNAKMKGEDNEYNTFTTTLPPRKVSTPGEIREEYEMQLERLREEEEIKRRREEKASENLIRTLQKEEMKEVQHLQCEKDLLSNRDFQFAKELRVSQINETLNSLKSSKSKNQTKLKINSSRSPYSVGPMDNYVGKSQDNSGQKKLSQEIQLPSKSFESVFASSLHLPSSNSHPSSRIFRDITLQCSSESESEFDSEDNVKRMKSKAKRTLSFKSVTPSPNSDTLRTRNNSSYEDKSKLHHSDSDVVSTQNSPVDDEGDNQILHLSKIFGHNQVTNDENLMKMIEEQKLLEEKIRQEREDRILALQLQKDLKQVDRSKGSEDEYCLRNQGKSFGLSSPRTPCGNFHNSSLSSSDESRKNKSSSKLRQTTLLESLSKKQRRV